MVARKFNVRLDSRKRDAQTFYELKSVVTQTTTRVFLYKRVYF